MRVLFINNYPMDHAWELWNKKEYPGHHLWGATHLHKYGIDIDILPNEKYVKLKKLGSKIKVLGDLDQELRILLREPKYDLIYSGNQYDTILLSIMRSLGLFRKPLVAILHHPIKEPLKSKLLFNLLWGGHDKFICLNNTVKTQLENEFDVPEENLSLVEWGVDLPFYDGIRENHALGDEPAFIVSAGKTYRDHDTLVQAFIETDFSLRIYCSEKSAPTIPHVYPNIRVQYNHPTQNAISFQEVLVEYKKSYAVAIPLKDTSNLAGLTSLLDAMAMGKAVIMTRNQQIDIDIEKEGIGIFVEPGDVEGWKQAIFYLLEHPQETEEMGNRARSLCESRYNLDEFSSKLSEVLKSVIFEKKM